MRRSIASRLSRPPRMLGKTGSSGGPLRSRSQASSIALVSGRSGAQRCFRPFPRQRTWAPVSRTTSSQFNPINSETRRPVCTATRRRVRSRRPIQVERFGIASRASISSRLRNSIGRRSQLGGRTAGFLPEDPQLRPYHPNSNRTSGRCLSRPPTLSLRSQTQIRSNCLTSIAAP